MGILEGQRVVVTGGASGIGAASASLFVAEGASVVIIDIDAERGQTKADELGASFVEANVADGEAFEAAAQTAAARLGGVDGLFNNAGIGNLKRLHEYTDKEWKVLVDVNLTGTFNGLRSFIPLLKDAGGGAIVHMASVSGVWPTRGEAPYSAAKAGVIALTKSAALEYGRDNIRVNVVSPGFIRTDLTEFAFGNPAWTDPMDARIPLGRTGTPEDVAGVAAFLMSDYSRYVTGQNILVDGGSVLPSATVDHLLSELLGE